MPVFCPSRGNSRVSTAKYRIERPVISRRARVRGGGPSAARAGVPPDPPAVRPEVSLEEAEVQERDRLLLPLRSDEAPRQLVSIEEVVRDGRVGAHRDRLAPVVPPREERGAVLRGVDIRVLRS